MCIINASNLGPFRNPITRCCLSMLDKLRDDGNIELSDDEFTHMYCLVNDHGYLGALDYLDPVKPRHPGVAFDIVMANRAYDVLVSLSFRER